VTAPEPTDDPMISYGRRLSQLAERHPEKVALVQAAVDGSERTVTWGELERRANQVARLLAERGVDAESLVAVALPNCPEHFFCCYGAWKLGATVLPMRWDLPAWERDRLVGLAKAQAVFADWPDATTPTISTAEIDSSSGTT